MTDNPMAFDLSRITPRRPGRRRRCFLLLGFLALACWATLDALYHFVYHHHRVTAAVAVRPPPSPQPERIYIASVHWNTEAILRSHWNEAVIRLAEKWGAGNVFVSVFESGSWDNTKGALRDLDRDLDRLGVRRNITLSPTTHREEISAIPSSEGWVDTPRGQKELRRIPYLARIRNWTLRPLEDLQRQGILFDKILFLGDVVFTVDDIIALLRTNDGVYSAACSLDFMRPPAYYDTFALRDSEGDGHLMPTWPYFRSTDSRNALLSMSPIPVKSCWNGIVAMPTEPFLSPTPLRFRGIPDSLAQFHLEASECCLIHADNPLSRALGVYLNPLVRVGYTGAAYAAVHPFWLSPRYIALGVWQSRLRRWLTTTFFQKFVVRRRVALWQANSNDRHEVGEFCLTDEMQVLIANGWAHV
ncbi:putative polysaccharide export protein [Aspergillus heteromorphus CBS 117.55]|uniref:Putative polysaccharide export protein n=1 Tax=Aspergillus heteromorphus CBS 117.55 TaxID=1448321 RepID=A0A317VSN1_9EURO|nr:putative polysaccharide export protein [Aspergillus heteromorphus CBS 117.55]PWY77384.1 putative polysaccharide export protein [Aspergillus heteromorphus CBS 117.55]